MPRCRKLLSRPPSHFRHFSLAFSRGITFSYAASFSPSGESESSREDGFVGEGRNEPRYRQARMKRPGGKDERMKGRKGERRETWNASRAEHRNGDDRGQGTLLAKLRRNVSEKVRSYM